MGHPVWSKDGEDWFYEDGSTYVESNPKPCMKCKKLPTKDGHDPCIANMVGVTDACCGHGVTKGYLKFREGNTIETKKL